MSRWHSYLNSASTILSRYKGEEPAASFLKKYFTGEKKFGSTDRKWISHLCYCYFRLGKALPDIPVEQRILTALFICSQEPNKLLEELKPVWGQQVRLLVEDKISLLGEPGLIKDIFPWLDELTGGIDKKDLSLSHLKQPDLFLRLRPGKEAIVKQKLLSAGINFDIISETCLALRNSSKIDSIIELDNEAVIQDHSSQRVGEFLALVRRGPSHKVWDCCAASGGKSIMAADILGKIDLTVSDVRASILSNLKKRFSTAGINNYKSFIADLASPAPGLKDEHFDLILADVPCSGSGTWGRTPEQLYFFEERKIDEYATLQKKILTNIIPHLTAGGHLLFITCSVFKKENEEAVSFIKEKFHLQMVKMELLKGYDKKADTMFAALLKKPL